jgi:hypothetical protein
MNRAIAGMAVLLVVLAGCARPPAPATPAPPPPPTLSQKVRAACETGRIAYALYLDLHKHPAAAVAAVDRELEVACALAVPAAEVVNLAERLKGVLEEGK